MSVLKPFPTGKFIFHCLLVFAIFMIINYLYYGLIAISVPYQQDLLNKVIWTLVLSIPFTYVFYNFNAGWWHPVKGRKKGSNPLAKGFWFGVVMGVAFIAIIALSGYVVMYSFIHLLDAFCGVPESGTDDAIIILQSGVSGAALAYTGKEESDVDQLRPPSGG